MKMRLPLLALAVGAFGIGTTEFAPMGMLPVIARGVQVSIPRAGMLITGYAVGVMLGAPLMTLATARLARDRLLILLMAIFTLGNFVSAFAPGYLLLLLARVLTSLAHGAFFGVGSIVAAGLVVPERRAQAVAMMFMGLTVATIGGVPLATWIGECIGWRAAFAGIGMIGLLAMLALWHALPHLPVSDAPDIRREIGVLWHPSVQCALAATSLGAAAMFTVLTYIVPILQDAQNASPTFINFMLVVIGVGFTLGNGLGGRLADRAVDGSLLAFLGVLCLLLLSFPLTLGAAGSATISLLLWGAATFAVVPPLQMRVMDKAAEAPGLAASVNIGAFNLGNAIGAAVGAAVIDFGPGYDWIAGAGAVLALAAIALVLLSRRLSRAGYA